MDVRERIDKFISYKGMTRASFERAAGLSNGYLAAMRKGLGVAKLESVLSAFPDLNREWLLTGEGEMLNQDATKTDDATMVSLIPVAAQACPLSEFPESVYERDCERVISPVKGADYAIRVSGESMAPEFPNGSMVLIKKINDKAYINWGAAFVLDTCNGVVLKRLTPGDTPDTIKCISINPDPIYAPFEVSREDIYGVYKVLCCLSLK